MRVLLMHPDRDWAEAAPVTERFHPFRPDPPPQRPPLDEALARDLAFQTLLDAMADGDEYLYDVAARALFAGRVSDVDTILHRQGVLQDCLDAPALVRALYAVAADAVGGERRYSIAGYARYPSAILHHAMEALRWFMDKLRQLRAIADEHAPRVRSAGLTKLFALMRQEFSDEYLAEVAAHLDGLQFRHGIMVSAGLGRGNEGVDYALHQPRADGRSWVVRLLRADSSGYRFSIHERDEAGARALGELRDRGIDAAANALAQSAQHILGFFEILRAELAFYVGCVNVHARLTALGLPTCLPRPCAAGARRRRFGGLYDVCLALQANRRVVGNTLDADGAALLMVTGANQGGKSTFLRSLGLAQIMMQSGMFVGAETFAAALAAGVFSHYKREEDAAMEHGKLDEELARMSGVVDALGPGALMLFNESFASTNEIEGSEIARQIVTALLDKDVTVVFVTHLYALARALWDQRRRDARFLRAARLPDGTRTFQMVEGEPLETSYGEDLYKEIFVVPASSPVRRPIA